MTDDGIELTRRKILGSVGAVGLAGAGAGLGTSAYFSDEETFRNNTINAGEFDLLLDYRLTYHGGSGRLEHIREMKDGRYADAKELDEEEGVYLLEQVPDAMVIVDGEYLKWDEAVREVGWCDHKLRKEMVNGDEIAPIELGDVKPGDSGCLTTSLHLCDNAGYIWMNGGLTANDDNGFTDPESEVDATVGAGDGELANNIETRVWYDENCDCELDQEGEGGGTVDIVLVLDRSGSMSSSMTAMKDAAKGLVDELDNAVANVGVVSYSSSATLDQKLTSDHGTVKTAIDGLSSSGQTHIVDGVETAQEELTDGTNARPDAEKIMVVMSDGEHNQGGDPVDAADDAKGEGIEIYTVAFGSADESTLQDMASDPWDAHFFQAANENELIDAFSQIGRIIAGERVIFEGTLEELTSLLSTGHGIPLDGNRETSYDEVVDGEPADGDDDHREPFGPKRTHCIGLEWELPPTVGNEVQSDSVVFDVGFYAEQARHNDGRGVSS
ncbi:vWA domain-containing protein [Natronosalvus rutilus]|uniref:VWA domain-containing protein n=1 Tax=Natronosalvus rutilus TaxID=2953753 RepID=A0A9E7N5M4_9EURY|nr:VWA domain-containing protein [Natronosalvus rutilus]UTF52005.1 VWA domain-containing protein [Natronosalvus rutilus]